MKETTPWDRLLPCLFDRLTDNDPGSQVESREKRSFTSSEYKKSVLRDLVDLLNSGSLFQVAKDELFPESHASVLNYGIKSFTGSYVNIHSILDIEREVKQAIKNFEPRIMKDTLVVRVQNPGNGDSVKHHNVLTIEIEGDLWLNPYPEQLYLKTEFDLETCEFKLVGN